MKRKLTEQELNAINVVDTKEEIATKKYGTQIDEIGKNKLRDRYFTEEIGIKEYSKYQKPSSWRGHTEIIYKDIVRDYSPSIQKILDEGKITGPDPRGYDGFYKYILDTGGNKMLEMIYNPETQEISHISYK